MMPNVILPSFSISTLSHALTLFLSLLFEAFPFLLLGILVSGLLLLWVDEFILVSILPRNSFWGALLGCLLGLLLPVGEYGNIPVTRRLLMQGVSGPVAIAFLLASPTFNPIVIWSTWRAFSDIPQVFILRFVFAGAIALLVAGVFATLEKRELSTSRRFGLKQRLMLLQSGTFIYKSKRTKRLNSHRARRFLNNTLQELREFGFLLVLGCAIATLVQMFFPVSEILGIGKGVVTSILAMMLLGVVTSTHSVSSAFVALPLAGWGGNGAILAFLLLGAIADIKDLILLAAVFRPKPLLYLLIIVLQLIFLLTAFISLQLG